MTAYAGKIVRASDLPSTLTAYTPTVSNWTLGNGTIVGRYQQIGQWVRFEIELTFGSTSTFVGNLLLGLPVAAAAPINTRFPLGLASLQDTSVLARRNWIAVLGTTTTSFNIVDGSTGNVVASANPWTWATTDTIYLRGEYEAA